MFVFYFSQSFRRIVLIKYFFGLLLEIKEIFYPQGKDFQVMHSALYKSINLKSEKKWNFVEVALCFPQRLNSMVYVNFSNGAAAATSPKWGPAD